MNDKKTKDSPSEEEWLNEISEESSDLNLAFLKAIIFEQFLEEDDECEL